MRNILVSQTLGIKQSNQLHFVHTGFVAVETRLVRDGEVSHIPVHIVKLYHFKETDRSKYLTRSG